MYKYVYINFNIFYDNYFIEKYIYIYIYTCVFLSIGIQKTV